MSVSAWIDVRMADPARPTFQDFVAFISGDFTPLNDNCIEYLPFGDKDEFNWTSRPASELANVISELERKWGSGEIVGITVLWRTSNSGGNLLVFPDRQVSLSCNINRRITPSGATDVTWYLDRILEAWDALCCVIETIEFRQHG